LDIYKEGKMFHIGTTQSLPIRHEDSAISPLGRIGFPPGIGLIPGSK